jgi:hypothetical protein
MNMLRLVRFIIMLVMLTSPFLAGETSAKGELLADFSAPRSTHVSTSHFGAQNQLRISSFFRSLRSAFLIPTASAFCLLCTSSDPVVPYCSDPNDCTIDKGTEVVKTGITSIETTDSFSVYIQKVIVYVLGFLTLIVVILIIWAGFSILTAAGDDEKVKTAKKIIFRAVLGLLVIFFAWAITSFIIGDGTSTGKGLINHSSLIRGIGNPFRIDSAFAANDTRGFEYYRARINTIVESMGREITVDQKFSTKSLNLLKEAIEQSKDTFSDSKATFNNNLANEVLNQIELIKKFPDNEVYNERLIAALKDFVSKIQVGTITAKITATPASGNAPFTTTLRAVEARDPSGVTIPESNYIWWIR